MDKRLKILYELLYSIFTLSPMQYIRPAATDKLLVVYGGHRSLERIHLYVTLVFQTLLAE